MIAQIADVLFQDREEKLKSLREVIGHGPINEKLVRGFDAIVTNPSISTQISLALRFQGTSLTEVRTLIGSFRTDVLNDLVDDLIEALKAIQCDEADH